MTIPDDFQELISINGRLVDPIACLYHDPAIAEHLPWLQRFLDKVVQTDSISMLMGISFVAGGVVVVALDLLLSLHRNRKP